MAQIIKHRRGSLESVASATKRAGELLVVTGSAGITATNGNSILFVGIDGSTVTPANKILQGTSVPDLSGASYDTSVDGIPFYDASAQKLYILNKGGNVEIKASANTGGTGIVSGSSQVTPLLPSGTTSGSSQITISSTTGYTDFSSSLNSRLVTSSTNVTELYASASNHEGRLDTIEASIGNGGAIESRIDVLEAYDTAQSTKNSTLATYTGSVNTQLTELYSSASNHETRVDSLETLSSSLDTIFVNETQLTTISTSLDSRLDTIEASIGNGGAIESRIDVLEAYDTAQDTKNSAVASYTGSINTKLSTLATYTGSVDTKFSTIGTYTGSVNSQLTELYATASNHELRDDRLEASQSAFETAIALSGTNVTINGNFTVSGTQTIVDSTTVQIGDNILELNGSGAANGGLWVKDVTAPNTNTGSIVWDSTNDYWKAGVKGSEIKVLLAGSDSVVSGSSQITISSTTGYSTFSSSLTAKDTELFGTSSDHESRIDVIETSLGGGGSLGTRVSNLETHSGSVVTKLATLATYTGSVNTQLTELYSSASNHEGRVDSLESWSSSLDATFVNETQLTTLSSSVDSRLVSLKSFEDGIATTIKTKLNTEAVVSGSSQIDLTATTNYASGILTRLNVVGVVSGSSQVNADTITNFDSNVKDKLNADAVVSGSSQLNGTTINALRVTAGELSGSFSGSFKGDGSQLTGLVTDLRISGSSGNDTLSLLSDTLLVTGSNGVSTTITNNTITINGVDASTTAKGVASFSATNFAVSSGNVTIKAGGVTAASLAAGVAGTGISLNGVDNSIEVDYGSTAGTAVEGNTSLTIQGTSNEIEISGGSVTLGSGGTVTIGLPNSVTIPTASIQNNLSVGGNISVTGNLYVQGTTTTIDSTTIQLGDNIIELNGSNAANGGLLVRDVTAPNNVSGSLLWDTTNDYWKGGALGSEKQFARLNATPTSGSVQVIGASGLLVDSHITDAGSNVTITSDLVINGLTANTFVVSNGSKKLISVAPSNAGDLIQWNGSSFVASNEIDGGTF